MHCIMRQIGLEENPEPLFERGPFLSDGFTGTPYCQEIAERVAVTSASREMGLKNRLDTVRTFWECT